MDLRVPYPEATIRRNLSSRLMWALTNQMSTPHASAIRKHATKDLGLPVPPTLKGQTSG